MFRRVATTVTDKVGSFFAKTEPHHEFIKEHTRFYSSNEMNGIREVLEKLNDKRFSLKKIADEKGVQSEEFASYMIINRIMDEAGKIISDYNQSPSKPDQFSNIKDLVDLTTRLKTLVAVSEQDKQTLNSVAMDKPIAKNAAVTSALFAVPAIPLALMLGPVGVLIGVAGSAALSKPANDYLTSAKIISWDTESKDMVMAFVEVVDKANKNLSTYIEENPQQDISQPQPSIKPN